MPARVLVWSSCQFAAARLVQASTTMTSSFVPSLTGAKSEFFIFDDGRPLGMVMLVKALHLKNAYFPILVMLSGIMASARLVHIPNASYPMLVTLMGILTLVMVLISMNAFCPMPVTGNPLVELG